MIELYHAHLSTCSQKVRLTLAEKGIEWIGREIDLARQDQLSDEYLALNPNGVVPTLVHDDAVIIDSSVICEYLDEVFPERLLSPATAAGRARMRAWMRYTEEVPTAAIRIPSYNILFSGFLAAIDDEGIEKMTDRMTLRKHFYRRMNKGKFDEKTFDESIERLNQTIARMSANLDNGPWMLGEELTIGDIVLVPTIVRMEDLGLADLWAKHPKVADWYDRIQARPSFDMAYYPGCRITQPLAAP